MSVQSLISLVLVAAGCTPAPVKSKVPAQKIVAKRTVTPDASPLSPRTAVNTPEEKLEHACDVVCAKVSQGCHGELGGTLARVTRCVKACVAERLPKTDRECYEAGATMQDRHRRHVFCSSQRGWPRLRPGGCIPASADGWVATRETRQACEPGFAGEKRHPAKDGAPHFAYCDAGGKLRVVLQREVVTPSLEGPPPIRHIARSDTHLVVFHARRANCGAMLRLAIVELAAHRCTVREIALNLGRKRWAARLELKADHAVIKALDHRGRAKDRVRVPLKPDRAPAISGRCFKLRHKLENRPNDDPDTDHPCLGVQSLDPDHCG